MSSFEPIPKDELRKMLKEYTVDELFEIAKKAYPDCNITKQQIIDEITQLEEK